METAPAITAQQLAYWQSEDADARPRPITMLPPAGMDNCSPCAAVITQDIDRGVPVVRTPWTPSPEDLVLLNAGGTIWLSTWGGLPPHQLEVQTHYPPPPLPAPDPEREA